MSIRNLKALIVNTEVHGIGCQKTNRFKQQQHRIVLHKSIPCYTGSIDPSSDRKKCRHNSCKLVHPPALLELLDQII